VRNEVDFGAALVAELLGGPHVRQELTLPPRLGRDRQLAGRLPLRRGSCPPACALDCAERSRLAVLRAHRLPARRRRAARRALASGRCRGRSGRSRPWSRC
jgi:hypothetical protein